MEEAQTLMEEAQTHVEEAQTHVEDVQGSTPCGGGSAPLGAEWLLSVPCNTTSVDRLMSLLALEVDQH